MPAYEVVILGSGFAGSLLGLLLRKQGLSVLVIDRARHPRFAIGESSTPAADFILESLCEDYGLTELRPLCRYGSWCRELPQVSRGLKRGFSYFHQRPLQPFSPGLHHENELLVAASPFDEVGDTHWFRADVDQYFAGQFTTSGGELWEETQIESVHQIPAGWELSGVRNGAQVSVRAGFVVDGTGGDSALIRWLKLPSRVESLRTHSRSIFGHFTGVPLWSDLLRSDGIDQSEYPYSCDQAALHHIIDGGWMWVLRFDNGITSLGWTLDARTHPLPNGKSPVEEWANLLERYPAVARQIAGAQPASPFSIDRPLVRTQRLQRLVGNVAGDSWALLPHTAGFIDPFYSTGIAHSLLGVERLARIIPMAIPRRLEALADYQRAVTREILLIDQLVSLAYKSMGAAPQLLHAATMLYFAGVTTFESRRRAGQGCEFLIADDPDYVRTVHELVEAFPETLKTEDDVISWTHRAEFQVGPWNSVGLFRPLHRNMYWQTANEKLEAD